MWDKGELCMNWIYKTDASNSARYILGIEGKNPLICVGVNPNTAEPNHLNRTLKSVETFSKMNGYDSWLMLNLYPQRATYPKHHHWIYLGNLTKRIHPRHPLYLSRQSCRHMIDIDSYYSNL